MEGGTLPLSAGEGGKPVYRYEEHFDALILCVHGSDPDAFLAGFIDLHLSPEFGVQD